MREYQAKVPEGGGGGKSPEPNPVQLSGPNDEEKEFRDELYSRFNSGITHLQMILETSEKIIPVLELSDNEENRKGERGCDLDATGLGGGEASEKDMSSPDPSVAEYGPAQRDPVELRKDALMAFTMTTGSSTVEMNRLNMDFSKIQEEGGLEEMKKNVGIVCTYCYNTCTKNQARFCGRCKVVPYCSARCVMDDWDSPRSLRHSEICDLYVRNENKARSPVGVFGDTLMRAYISQEFGCGMTTLQEFDKNEIVFIDRPARESDEERKAREEGSELVEKYQRNRKSKERPFSDEEKADVLKLCRPSFAQKVRSDLFVEKIKLLRLLAMNTACCEVTTFSPCSGSEDRDLCMLISFLNHSCDPNCYLYSFAGRYYLISLKKISVGDQLTIRYDDPYAIPSKELGREWYANRLWNRYGIVCPETCSCTNEKYWESYNFLATKSDGMHQNVIDLVKMHYSDEKSRIVKSAKNAIVKKTAALREEIEAMLTTLEAEGVMIPDRFYLTILELECNILTRTPWKKKELEENKKKIADVCGGFGIDPEYFFGQRYFGES